MEVSFATAARFNCPNILYYRIGSAERPKNPSFLPPTPGPGTYQSISALAGPKFSMRSKHDKSIALLPGPGAYTPKHEFDASLKAAPAYS